MLSYNTIKLLPSRNIQTIFTKDCCFAVLNHFFLVLVGLFDVFLLLPL